VTLLAEKINANRRSGIRCLNFGTNGDTSGYMLERARRHIIPDKADPGDIVIIMGGANDVLMYGANEDDVTNIMTIAELFRAKNCTPIIGIQPGFRESDYAFYGPLDPDKLNANFNQFADSLLTRAKDAGVATFDLRPVLSDPALFEDGVHPTEEGHQLIADTVREVIAPLLQK
jgi:lysophospholipase L1-like esterase